MAEEVQFKRALNLVDSTSIVVGSMIGSGIFIVSADMARILGSPGWLLIVWLITGFMTITAALSYGELAGMMPKAGGQYVYLREAYNPMIGFLFGWTMFTVIQTGTIAAVAMAFAKFTGVLIPWFSADNVLFSLWGLKINTPQLLAISTVILLTIINLKGIRLGKYVQNFFTFTKISALALVLIAGLLIAKNFDALSVNLSYFWDAAKFTDGAMTPISGWVLIGALGTAMVGSLFSADAWNNITFAAGEVVNPKKNIPLSLFLGTSIVILLYILANLVYLSILPLRGAETGISVIERGIQFASSDRVGTAALEILLGGSASAIMAIFILFSTFGCNNGLILAGSRIYYAMSKDKLFFKSASELNKNGVPSKAMILQCIWTCLLCLSGTYGDLLDYVVFAVLIFYVLTIIGVYILRIRKPNEERPYKAFGYPVLPAIYVILAIAVIIILLINKPNYTIPGLIIVLTGLPVYFIWKATTKKREV
jgi:APA family basic amino acid/polyamine antiporter